MAVHLAVAGDVFDGVIFSCPFFLRDVLGEIWDLIESVSEGFPTHSFSFGRVAVACSILERISGLSPHLKELLRGSYSFYGTKCLPFYLYFPLDTIGAVCHQFGLLSTDLHLISCAGSVATFNKGF